MLMLLAAGLILRSQALLTRRGYANAQRWRKARFASGWAGKVRARRHQFCPGSSHAQRPRQPAHQDWELADSRLRRAIGFIRHDNICQAGRGNCRLAINFHPAAGGGQNSGRSVTSSNHGSAPGGQ